MTTILNGIDLGVQSWCFRDFRETRQLIKLLDESGLDTIEICNAHCRFNGGETDEKLITDLEAAGVKINSIGINGMGNNEEKLRNQFEFARRAGFTAIGADLDVDVIPLVEKLCDEYGVKIAIHNHGRYHRYGSIQQLENLFAQCSGNVGLCLDTGWALDSRLDPLDYIRKFSDRMYGLHFKDFNFDAEGKPLETVLGTGKLDLAALLDMLKKINYSGYASIEYEGDASDPAPKIKACVENLKKLNA